ncbi:hypothetical protein Cri9333_1217 [Crinalium epipsammum PCC 9333]|uniref:NACHT domain-containing protein n=1 Tax=Crinalium epipsammum PCC 9333 TaxID=1173022 RepID=K9VVJ3_9CYAN|nr:NACHT domain-containing protein [Crinalium epipsammum]AFZ12118.1 hypothetical protein Cri9333_1217 [Crinalium epipsammum PCC 9333]
MTKISPQPITQMIIPHNGVVSATKQASDKNREQLIQKVKLEVKQRLDGCLHTAIQISLQRNQPQQVQRLSDVDVKIGRRSTYRLSPDISITQVFDDTAGRLLILGALGTGKTTTLLELAKDLIIRAENNHQYPLPVLFNLSDWKDDNQAIADWLVNQLHFKYGIKVLIGNQWIEQQQILPLLDGLDELELSQQERCIHAINQLLQRYNPPKYIVVCTRLEAYKNYKTWLRLNGAVYLRPLNELQIQEYLLSSRSRELWENLKTERELLALAKIPVMLCMMTFAYEDILMHSWKRLNSRSDRTVYLLNAYIRRMLTRNISSSWYRRGKQPSSDQTRRWLTWLAQKMQQQNQIEFAVESMHASWLLTPIQKKKYNLGIRLSFGIIVTLISVLLAKIISGWITAIIIGLIAGIIAGFVAMLIPSIPIIEDFTLRLILLWDGYTPWNYVRFLNYASERLLLQKAGDRYRFIHAILQDHFAKMS